MRLLSPQKLEKLAGGGILYKRYDYWGLRSKKINCAGIM